MQHIKSMFFQYRGLSRAAYILFLGRMITNMGAFIWPLLTLILSQKIGLSASESAYATTGLSLFYLIGSIAGGKLADHFNRKKIIIVFDIISTVFFISCAFIQPGFWMILLFGLAGLFASMEGPAYDALVADATKPAEREKVYSLSYLGHNLGYMFGAAIGGLLFNNYLPLAFIFDGLTTISSTLLIILFVFPIAKETLTGDEINEYENDIAPETTAFALMKKRPPLLFFLPAVALSAFVYSQWGFSLPLYTSYIFGENGPAYYGFLSSFNAFVVILFTPIFTYLLRRLPGLLKAVLGVSLYSASFLLILGGPPYFVFFLMIFIFTAGEIINTIGNSPYISRRVPSSHRGRLSAIIGIGYGVGATTSRLIIGRIIDNFSYLLAFTAIIGTGLAAVLLLLFVYRLDKKYFPRLYENLPGTEKLSLSDDKTPKKGSSNERKKIY